MSEEATGAGDHSSASEAQLPTRALTDPRSLRAISHPLRIQLRELLFREGPLTATQCAVRLHDSPSNCSYHLRQLAQYGFVQRAEGRGRERPWQAVPEGMSFSDREGGPATRQAAEVLKRMLHDQKLAYLAQWPNRRRNAPEVWQDLAESGDYGVRITPAELADIRAKFFELLAPYQRRTFDGDDPPDSYPVNVLYYFLPDEGGMSYE